MKDLIIGFIVGGIVVATMLLLWIVTGRDKAWETQIVEHSCAYYDSDNNLHWNNDKK